MDIPEQDNPDKNPKFPKIPHLKSSNLSTETIIKPLDDTFENWTYKKLNETNRIARELKDKINRHDFS